MSDKLLKRSRCAYRPCPSTVSRDVTHFTFPRDPNRSRLWLEACNRLDLVHKKLHLVYTLCEKHFEKKSIIQRGPRKVLSENAIPTIFMSYTNNEDNTIEKTDGSSSREDFLSEPCVIKEPEDVPLPSKIKKDGNQPLQGSNVTSTVTLLLENENVIYNQGAGEPTFAMTNGPQLSQGFSTSVAGNISSGTMLTSNTSDPKQSSAQHPPGQPQLVVLLDSNYGLPSVSTSTAKNTGSNIYRTSATPVVSMNNVNTTVMNNMKTQIVNGANISQIVYAQPQGIVNSSCRCCLNNYPTTSCHRITSPCFLEKTVKDAISQIVPKVTIPFQETDVVCNSCFDTLKDCLRFAMVFERTENVLASRWKQQNGEEISFRTTPQYTPLGDNSNLEPADKIISLSKIDNDNLTKFVQSLLSNEIKIFKHEKNPFARKRVLLLGNSKWRMCHLCNAKFLAEGLLLNHLKTEHKENYEKAVEKVSNVNEIKCRVCTKTFTSRANLKKHAKWCVNFPCSHCPDHKKFPCMKLLEHSEAEHGDKLPFKCFRCKEHFSDFKSYIIHKSIKHSEQTCNKCNKTFPSYDLLQDHDRKYKEVPCHVPSRTCVFCKKVVNLKEFAAHISDHRKKQSSDNEHIEELKKIPSVKTHKCTDCDKIFLKAETLLKHKETHELSKIEEQTCEICNETFDNVESLREHIRNNHGDPTVMCELCGEECEPDALKEHIESRHGSDSEHIEEHTPENNLSNIEKINSDEGDADETGANESQLVSFENQEGSTDFLNEEYVEGDLFEMGTEEVIQSEKDIIEEEEIEQKSSQSLEENAPKRRKMYNFAVNVPSGPVVCKYCLKSFSNGQQLMKHIQTHFQAKKSEKCSECDKRFYSKASRIKHEQSHSEAAKKFRCNICWRTTQNQDDLDSHMKTHDNTLDCEKCSEKFAYKWQLVKHYSSHPTENPNENGPDGEN